MSNHHVVHLKLMLYVNYNSIKKEKEKKTNKNKDSCKQYFFHFRAPHLPFPVSTWPGLGSRELSFYFSPLLSFLFPHLLYDINPVFT